MINKHEVEEIITSSLEELNGKLSKPTYRDNNDTPIQTMYEAEVSKDSNGDLLFTFKEDIFSQECDRYRIKIEYE